MAALILGLALFAAGCATVSSFEAIDLIYLGMTLAFGGTGAVIRRNQPGNPIGHLFGFVCVAAGLAELTHGIADRTEAPLVALYANASWIPLMLPGITLLLLVFPDGKVLTRRWRLVLWAAAAGIVLALVATLLKQGPIEDYPDIENPIGVAAAEGLEGLSWLLILVGLVGGPASLVLRMRRGGRVERQQIKWLALAGGFAALAMAVGLPALIVGVPETPIYVVMMLAVLAVPCAAAVAILRYRLYDVDVVINRALVYTGLTVALAGTYVGSVLLLQLFLPARSDLAIAASTLAVAALFQPARRRIQAIVDRRFYRRRYDAAQTLLAFGAHLRDEVDLDALSGELRGVVAETMQPAHVSLWLR